VKERLGLLAVVLLVVANAFLIPLAFQNAQGSPAEDAGEPAPTSVDATEPSAITEDGSGDQPVDIAPMMMASAGKLIVGATRNSCRGVVDPYLGISDDGGKTFRTVKADPKVTAVLAVEVTDNQRVLVLAADDKCRTVGYESRDGGRSWDTVDPKRRWHLDGSADARRVHSPNGPVATPCVPQTMSTVRNDVMRLLCRDGRILRPDGEAWTVVGQVKGAVAISFPTPEVGVALAPQGKCASAVMRTTDSGATWKQQACLEGAPPRGISGQDGKYVAVAGDKVQISDDRAETWRKP
jgi:hypothetical protein